MPLDSVLQEILDQLPSIPDGPPDYPLLRQQADQMVSLFVGPEGPAEVGSVDELELPGSGAAVPVRIYRPAGQPSGTLHYIHGGGWSIGNLEIVDHTARRLCRDLSIVVVTSTYRLAPEHPFPAAFDDSLVAACWVSRHRAELGGETLPAVIAGDSAGGNLATAICLAMRDAPDDIRSFDLQLLLYPAVDLRLGEYDYESRRRDADPSLRSKSLEICVNDYIGDADASDERISPIAANNLVDLPMALVVVLSVDPLRDEAVEYAGLLQKAGVHTRLLEFDNLTHGFVHLAGLIPAAAIATDQVLETLRLMLSQLAQE